MGIVDLVFPQRLYCSCCGNMIDESRTYGLCDYCMARFRWNGERPAILSEDYPEELRGSALIHGVEYGLFERSLIFRLKYNGDKGVARDIAEMLADKIGSIGGLEGTIIPVPMHRFKEKKRGFNQTGLIGKHLSGFTGLEFLPGALVRTRETESMRGLNPEERRLNMLGSIEVNPNYEEEVKGKRIILLDDFFTTGATAAECVRALKGAGAEKVDILVYARRTPMEELAESI